MADETRDPALEADGSEVATPVPLPAIQPVPQDPIRPESEGLRKDLDGPDATASANQSLLESPSESQMPPRGRPHDEPPLVFNGPSKLLPETPTDPTHEHEQHSSERLEDFQSTDFAPAAITLSRPASVVPPERAYIKVESQHLASGSIDSTKSSNTRIVSASLPHPSDSASNSPLSRPQDPEALPNQAYAALQTQHHPRPYSSQSVHMWASNSGSHLQPSEHMNDEFHFPSDAVSTTNSANSSPGLFATTSSPLRPSFAPTDTQVSYSSPYLHHTHRQVPKE
jgi:[calcium/calmodulin-dependent protein kinase] kinase